MVLQQIQTNILRLLPTLPSSIDLAFTDKKYKFPQVWKTTIALDQKLPLVL
jgi:hypothetical protein